MLPGPRVRGSKLAGDVREAAGSGGVVGEASGSFSEVHSDWRTVPARYTETISDNSISRKVALSSLLELGNSASPTCHCF